MDSLNEFLQTMQTIQRLQSPPIPMSEFAGTQQILRLSELINANKLPFPSQTVCINVVASIGEALRQAPSGVIELSEPLADLVQKTDDSIDLPEPDPERKVRIHKKVDLATFLAVLSVLLGILNFAYSIYRSEADAAQAERHNLAEEELDQERNEWLHKIFDHLHQSEGNLDKETAVSLEYLLSHPDIALQSGSDPEDIGSDL